MKKIVLLLSVFVLVFAFNTFAYASTSVTPPDLNGSNDSYIIYYQGDLLSVITYNSDDWSFVLQNGNTLVWTKNRETAYVRYANQKSYSGWENYGWGTLFQYDPLITYGCDEIVSSSHNVYDTDGKVVFLVPPPLKEKTEEALTNFQVKTGGMMNTLVLCGVGCLALLTVLKLFGKRSLIFHI